jgi:hypothetical protein
MSTADEAIKAAPPTGLERLLRRKSPEVVHHLRAAEPHEEAAARQAVADARERLETASWRSDEQAQAAITAAQAEVDQARAALAACYEPVVIRALPPKEFEALVDEHPARDGKDEPYNPETLNMELFHLCVQGNLSREQWETEVIPQLSKGELLSLETAAIALNGRTSDGSIPKD